MLDWNDFRIVLAISRMGTLSGAARTLKVNQSTISRALQRIERQARFPLFLNLAGRYQITPEGTQFLDVSEQMDRIVTGVELSVVHFDSIEMIRLTSIESVVVSYLLPKLAEFKKRFPAVSFELNGSNETMNLLKRGYDVALRMDREKKAASLIQRKVSDVGVAAYAKLDNKSTARRITHADWIGYESALGAIPEEKWLRRKLKGRVPRLRVGSYVAMEKAIQSGFGTGLLPIFIGDKNPDLVKVSGNKPVLNRSLWLICHPEARRQPGVSEFVKWLVAEFARDKDELQGLA